MKLYYNRTVINIKLIYSGIEMKCQSLHIGGIKRRDVSDKIVLVTENSNIMSFFISQEKLLCPIYPYYSNPCEKKVFPSLRALNKLVLLYFIILDNKNLQEFPKLGEYVKKVMPLFLGNKFSFEISYSNSLLQIKDNNSKQIKFL